MRHLILATAAATLSGATVAADLSGGEAVELLSAAAGTCLVNIHDIDSALEAFRGSGWEIIELDGGAWEMTGPGGAVHALANAEGYCRLEAEGVAPDEAHATVRRLLNLTYPDQFRVAGPGPCDGFQVTTFDGLIDVRLDGLGQDPVCPDPAGAAIVVDTGG